MKRINGTGCVTKLSGNRRNPWYAKVTTGYNEETGKATIKILSDNKGQKYFPNRTIPDLLLANWNLEKGNINLDKSDYTFSQVYEEYSKANFPNKEEIKFEEKYHQKAIGKLGKSNANNLKSAYNKCKILYKKLYKSLRKKDFEEVILSVKGCKTVLDSLPNLFRKLDDYAYDNDIIIKKYADSLTITEGMYIPIQNEGIPYSYKEIDLLWQYMGLLEADITLSTIYTRY